jgi:hypothetical protein
VNGVHANALFANQEDAENVLILYAAIARLACVKNVEMEMNFADVMENVIGAIEKLIADRMDGLVMNVIDGGVMIAD